MSNEEETNGHGRPAGEEGANAAPEGNDYGEGNPGGGAPKGPANGNWKSGLYSQYLTKEDREVIKQIDGQNAAEKLESLIDLNMARVFRAARELHGPEYVERLVDGENAVEELAMKDGPLADRAEALSKMLKRYNDMVDGEKINVNGAIEHTHQTELRDEEREHLDELF